MQNPTELSELSISSRAAVTPPFSAAARAAFQQVLVAASTNYTYADLVSYNGTAWVVNPAVQSGENIVITDSATLDPAALLAVLAVTGNAATLGTSGANVLSGASTDLLALAYTGQYALSSAASITATDTAAVVQDLLSIYSMGGSHEIATPNLTALTGAAISLSTLLSGNYTSLTANLDYNDPSTRPMVALTVTDQIGMATLANLKTETNGAITATVADSVLHLAGHTADAGVSAYVLVDTVAHLAAAGSTLLSGAQSLVTSDTLANLAGHTSGTYYVADSMAHIAVANSAGDAILAGAASVIKTDSLTNLWGYVTAGIDHYVIVDSFAALSDFYDWAFAEQQSGSYSDFSFLVYAKAWAFTDATINLGLLDFSPSADSTLDMSAATTITGTSWQVLSALATPRYDFSGTEAITIDTSTTLSAAQVTQLAGYTSGLLTANVSDYAANLAAMTGHGDFAITVQDNVSVAQLTTIEGLTTGSVSATVEDTIAHLVSYDSVNHVWVVNPAITTGDAVVLQSGALDVDALTALLAVTGGDISLAMGATVELSGSAAALVATALQIDGINGSTGASVHVTVTGTTAAAQDILTIWGNTGRHALSTPNLTTLTGAAITLDTLLTSGVSSDFGNPPHIAVTVTDEVSLGSVRRLQGETTGAVSATVADSVQHLTGHTTDASVTSYVVVDTVAHLAAAAGSTLLSGASSVITSDTLVNLVGHTSGAYIVADTLANIAAARTAADPLLTNAASVTIRDTLAHLQGHVTPTVDTFEVVDSAANIQAFYLDAQTRSNNGDYADFTMIVWARNWIVTDQSVDLDLLTVRPSTEASLDLTAATTISSTHYYALANALASAQVNLSGSEALVLTDVITAAQAAQLDAYTTGVVTANISDLAANLATMTASGDFTINVINTITVAQLQYIDAHTTGAVTATVLDTVAHLISQDPTTLQWILNSAIPAGVQVTLTAGEVNVTALAALSNALGSQLNYGVDRVFVGAIAEFATVLADSPAVLTTTDFNMHLTDASLNVQDLFDVFFYSNAQQTTIDASAVTGSAGQLQYVFFQYAAYLHLSGTESLAVTGVTVAQLAEVRAEFAAQTSGAITETLSDTVAHLTGHTSGAGVTGYDIIDTLANIEAISGSSLLSGAHGVAVHDTVANLTGYTGAFDYTVVDTVANIAAAGSGLLDGAVQVTSADSLANLSGHVANTDSYVVVDTLADLNANHRTLSALESHATSWTITDTTIDAADLLYTPGFGGAVDLTAATLVSGTYAELAAKLGNAQLQFSSTEEVSIDGAANVAQLTKLDAYTSGALDYAIIADSSSHLATLSNGTWTASSYVHDGVNIVVTDTISAAELAALDAANGSGTVSALVIPETTSYATGSSTTLAVSVSSSAVTSVVVAEGGGMTVSVAAGGVVNMNGVEGANTIVLAGYSSADEGSVLTMMQSGSTAIFWDTVTNHEVAAIGLNSYSTTQTVQFNDGYTMAVTLVGSVIELGHLTAIAA